MATTNGVPRHQEYQYLDLVRQIIETGEHRPDRTGTGTLALPFPPQLRFSLRHGALPLLTTKKVFTRAILHELLWFISGNTSSRALSAQGVKIWDANGSRGALDRLGLQHRAEGDLGPVYGFQWRHFGAEYKTCDDDYAGQGVDQLAEVVRKIMHSPYDRRIIMSAWNPKDIGIMALPPCHMFAQFYVGFQTADGEPSGEGELNAEERKHGRKILHCLLYQRSCDMGLGVPFNIASYALLTHMIAHATGCEAGELVHTMGDAHVYVDHVEALKTQLERTPREWPTVRIGTKGGGGIEELDAMKYEDFTIEGYDPWPSIKMNMSV